MRGFPVLPLVFIGIVGFAAPAHAACVDYASEPARLVELEADASRGALSEETKACLETSYADAKIQTTKGKISRVELVNAYAYDTKTWAKLVQRHLDEVERSDPNIAYLYAFYLFNRPQPDYEAVIKWDEVAMDRRTEWSGDVLVARTFQLHRARTYAAYEAWKAAEDKGSPDKEDLRARAKTFAREWLDFAREAGKDTKESEDLCISAASRSACGLN